MQESIIQPKDFQGKSINGWEAQVNGKSLYWNRMIGICDIYLVASPQIDDKEPNKIKFYFGDAVEGKTIFHYHTIYLDCSRSLTGQKLHYMNVIDHTTRMINENYSMDQIKNYFNPIKKTVDETIQEGEKKNKYSYLLEESDRDKSRGEFVRNDERKILGTEMTTPANGKPIVIQETPSVLDKLHDKLIDKLIAFDKATQELAEVIDQTEAYRAAYKQPALPIDRKYPFKKPFLKMAKKVEKWVNKSLKNLK